MNKVIAASLLVGSLFLAACSGGDEAEAEATTASALSVVERCDEALLCRVGSETPTVSILTKDGATCRAGSVALEVGGRAVSPSIRETLSWTATSTDLSICTSAGCMRCETVGKTAASSSAPAAGKCIGTSSSCSGLGAGSCSAQDGCSFTQHVHYGYGGTYLAAECEGTAKSCDELDSRSSCEDQIGCRWK